MKNGEIPEKIKKITEFQNIVSRYCMSIYKLELPDSHIEDREVFKKDCIAHGHNLIAFAKGLSPFNNDNFYANFADQKQFIDACKEFFKEHALKYSIVKKGVVVKTFETLWIEQEQEKLRRFVNNEIECTFFYRDQLSEVYPEGIPSKSR